MTEQDPKVVAERIRSKDAYLPAYLLGWCGMGPGQPWGGAMGFAMEIAAGYGLIRSESDATPTDFGRDVATALQENPHG